uniref:Putative ATPase domain containing protein n=1 Tax=viral metagenome TaxID=1070528 RepID=A0A6M3KB63_9ZZZZ
MDIEQTIAGFKVSWPDKLVHIQVKRLHDSMRGLSGEVTVAAELAGYPSPLHRAQFNFSSTNARRDLIKILSGKVEALPWVDMMEEFCNAVLDGYRQGEPAVEIYASEGANYKPPPYLVYPFLQQNKPTILFGEGGKGKSLLSQLLAMAVVLPWTDNNLGLRVNGSSTKVLWLDYETDKDTFTWNLSRLCNGQGLPEVSIFYRRCALPLAGDVEAIRDMVAEHTIGLVVIDSLGMACSGDLNKTDTAFPFWAAERQLKCTSLIIAHPSKDQFTKKATVHGSGFFTREARSVWELSGIGEAGEDEISIGLHHRKVNDGRLHKDRGYRLEFCEDAIKFEKQDIDDIPELRQHKTTQGQILGLLKRGAMTKEAMAIELDISPEAARKALERLKRKGQVMEVKDGYGLSSGQVGQDTPL